MIDPIKINLKEIKSINLEVKSVEIPQNFQVIAPPVTTQIGVPVVDMPGCVEARESNAANNQLVTQDQRGNLVLCDGNVPSYDPINFEPNQIIPIKPASVDTKKKEEPKSPDVDAITPPPPAPPATASIQCPTPAQEAKEPIGAYIEGFRKKVTGYELIGDQCVQLTESVAIPEQIIAGLPSGGQVMMTGGIAVIATTSAIMAKPLADILLKVVKPTVKKVMKKINTIRGKPVKVLSIAERRNEQRARNRVIMELRQTLKPK